LKGSAKALKLEKPGKASKFMAFIDSFMAFYWLFMALYSRKATNLGVDYCFYRILM
jgi:hypothetical protein